MCAGRDFVSADTAVILSRWWSPSFKIHDGATKVLLVRLEHILSRRGLLSSFRDLSDVYRPNVATVADRSRVFFSLAGEPFALRDQCACLNFLPGRGVQCRSLALFVWRSRCRRPWQGHLSAGTPPVCKVE